MKKILLVLLSLSFGLRLCAQTANANYPEGQLAPSYAADTGAANTLVASPTSGCPTALVDGMVVRVLPGHANSTTTPTLNWCNLGAKTITKFGTSAVAANDLTTTAKAIFVYDATSTDYQLINPQTAGSSGTVQDGGGTTTANGLGVSTGTAHVIGYNLNDIVQSDGHFSTYDGLTTAGLGLDVPLAVSDVTAQSASQTTVNLIASTSAAGHYMVRMYLDQSALCATGTGSVYATVSWTDASHARQAQTVPLTLANTTNSATAGYIDAAIPLWSAAASAISYTTTYAACGSGTATYDLHAEIERTN